MVREKVVQTRITYDEFEQAAYLGDKHSRKMSDTIHYLIRRGLEVAMKEDKVATKAVNKLYGESQ
jgi:hypothetical protein